MNPSRPVTTATLNAAIILLLAGCSGSVGTTVRPMGEAVPVGALNYTVLEVEWRNDLGSTGAPKAPKNRFAIVRLSINNAGGREVSIPTLHLEDANGKSFPESTDVEGLGDWMGLLRVLDPGASQQGRIVFDVPPGAYRLRLSSSGDPADNQTALVEIPLRVPQASELP